MIELSADIVEGLPVDQLGLAVLADLVKQNEWNEHNYLNSAEQAYGAGEALLAVAEAMAWLRARALIARRPGQTADSAIIVTRTGRRVLAEGPTAFYATERLQGGVHPLIEETARPQFLIDQYELGVFASMKAVEVRVRRLGKFGDEVIGTTLMNKAFASSGGPLTDPSATPGEKDGTRFLFVGTYAVLRNPSGHRDVNYDDVAEAAEAVHTASLLMRILDRVEARRDVLDRDLMETVSKHLAWANLLVSELPDSQAAVDEWRDRAGGCLHQMDNLADRLAEVTQSLAQQLRMYTSEPVADVAPVYNKEHEGWKRKLTQYATVLLRIREQLGGPTETG